MRNTCLVLVATALAIWGTTSPSASAATIDVGDGETNGLYQLDVFIDSLAKANTLLNTTGDGALAYSKTSVSGGMAGTTGRLFPAATDVTGTVIYHFHAADGYVITQADVINSLSLVAPSTGDFIQPSYSTTNLPGSYVNYGGVTEPGLSDTDYASRNLTVGAQDLYLRYDLFHTGNAFVGRVLLFESTPDTDAVGWSVDLSIAPANAVPEPATLSLVTLGAALLLRRRSR